MTLNEIVTVIALIAGPVIAVQLTRYLDNQKEVRQRKLIIFKTLMATRASALSPHHVEALNLIDLEFDNRTVGERSVLEAWRAYLDLLGDLAMPKDQWGVRRVDLLIELLHAMAKVLGFPFDKTTIKNSSYYPTRYGEVEEEQHAIRRSIREMLDGRRSIPIYITNAPPGQPKPPPSAPEPGDIPRIEKTTGAV